MTFRANMETSPIRNAVYRNVKVMARDRSRSCCAIDTEAEERAQGRQLPACRSQRHGTDGAKPIEVLGG